MNRVRSLLNLLCILLEYSFDPGLKARQLLEQVHLESLVLTINRWSH